jgi:hypothetical protein
MIASIARTKAASVVTRDTGDFEHCGLTVVDPWDRRVNGRIPSLLHPLWAKEYHWPTTGVPSPIPSYKTDRDQLVSDTERYHWPMIIAF